MDLNEGVKMRDKINSEKDIVRVLIIFFLLSSTTTCLAQSNNLAKDMSQKLKEKVLLSDSQTKNIENILNDYISAKTSNQNSQVIKRIKDDVSRLLDKKQKIKFDVIQYSWWNEVDESLAELKAK
jgi:hypothetical protein